VLWDGSSVSTGGGRIHQRVAIGDRATLCRLVANPLFQFGEAYSSGRLDVEGDLTKFLTTLCRSLNQPTRDTSLAQRLSRWLRRFTGSTLSGACKNIHHHYDLGNDFYRLWLDEQMVYTCAYFGEAAYSLEQAQTAKMDHVCRKVGLRPGETVVEAGCGWGALARHMARYYDVRVKAYNISIEQIRFAREQARREGLEDRVEFVHEDWRNIRGKYDAFVAVGMLEHVGLRNYSKLGDVIHRSLKPAGRGLIHSIGRNRPGRVNSWIERRIFPGSYAPTLGEIARVLQPHDFSITDVENLRLHYAETLRHWLDRFEQSVERVDAMFDRQFVRMWRLYLVGSMAAFQTGGLQLFQVTFHRGGDNHIPRTRKDLYLDPARPECVPSD
jgi:cyclopropane-fatty-acyl-phospholipid synthase